MPPATNDWHYASLPQSKEWDGFSSPMQRTLYLCYKGSRPFKKVQFFLTLFKRPLTPPPFYLNICPILQGVFFHVVNFLNDAPPYAMARMSSPHLKCCINVGFREAPCKKSFGILASYWTPPKNQVNARLYLGRGVQGVKIWYNVPISPPNFTINASKVPYHANFMLLNDLQNTRQFPT